MPAGWQQVITGWLNNLLVVALPIWNMHSLWQVLKPNLAFETVKYTEKDNLWIGPKQVCKNCIIHSH